MNNRDIHAIGTTEQEIESESNIRMSLIRIKATIFFETRRTLKKFMILLIIMLAFFILALTSFGMLRAIKTAQFGRGPVSSL